MKVTVEVEVDLECFGESLENAVMDKISERITQKFFNDIYINACQKMGDKVDSFIDEALVAFMDRRIVVTDNWGDKVHEHENVHEMLKDRFDKFMTERVDDKGRVAKEGCSYNGEDTRIRHIVDKAAVAQIDKFTRTVSRTVEKQLRELLSKSLEENLSGTVFKNILQKHETLWKGGM